MFIHAAVVECLATLLLNKCVGPVGRHSRMGGKPVLVCHSAALTTEMNTKYEIIINLLLTNTTVIIISRLLFKIYSSYRCIYEAVVA